MSQRYETLDAAKEEADKLGATFNYERGGKRFIGSVGFNGKIKKIAISICVKNPRVLKNIKEDVRKAVRELKA